MIFAAKLIFNDESADYLTGNVNRSFVQLWTLKIHAQLWQLKEIRLRWMFILQFPRQRWAVFLLWEDCDWCMLPGYVAIGVAYATGGWFQGFFLPTGRGTLSLEHSHSSLSERRTFLSLDWACWWGWLCSIASPHTQVTWFYVLWYLPLTYDFPFGRRYINKSY